MARAKFIVGLLFILALLSCGKSYKQRASDQLKIAIAHSEKGDSLLALQQLDSIALLFPEAFEVIEQSKALKNRINSEILFRKQDQLGTVNEIIGQLLPLFVQEKTEFDRFVRYVPKSQTSGRRLNTSFIEVHLNEQGDLFISSNYFGSEWLNHTALRVYDGVYQAKTDTVSLTSSANYHGDFMNNHWERVSYKDGKDNGVIQFVSENTDRNLKAAFIGKRMYYIVLEQQDKLAIRDALSLSTALKSRIRLEKEIRTLQTKIK